MSDDVEKVNKTERPHAHFDTPHEVVVDPALSQEEKIEALDSLEQDARQLAIASGEGMSDGEETGLKEVLHAKDVMKLPPIEIAYEVVLQDLVLKMGSAGAGEDKAEMHKLITALNRFKAQSAA